MWQHFGRCFWHNKTCTAYSSPACLLQVWWFVSNLVENEGMLQVELLLLILQLSLRLRPHPALMGVARWRPHLLGVHVLWRDLPETRLLAGLRHELRDTDRDPDQSVSVQETHPQTCMTFHILNEQKTKMRFQNLILIACQIKYECSLDEACKIIRFLPWLQTSKDICFWYVKNHSIIIPVLQ